MNDEPRAVIVRPGEGARVGNVEFLVRTVDTPRFNVGVIDFAAGRVLEPHVHTDEDDSFFILSGEITFMLPEGDVVARPGTFVLIPPGVEHGFRNDTAEPAQILNIHAPGGFDRRIGLSD